MAEKLARPVSSSVTTSPSRTALGVLTARGRAAATVANRSVSGFRRREKRVASPASTYATTRYPSHLTSCSHPFPRGTSFASVASIGS